MKKNHVLLFGILFLGLFVRLFGLTQSLWIDEAFSLYNTQFSFTHIWQLYDTTPPLFYFVLSLWQHVFGTNLFVARILPLIFGVLSIWVIYLLGKKLYGVRVGLLASLFFSLAPVYVYYSSELRAYSLFFLLALVSMYFYVDFDMHPTLYTIATVALLYTHVYAVFIVFAQNVRIWNKSWILSQGILFLSFLPWLLTLPNILATKSGTWLSSPSFFDVLYALYQFSSGRIMSFTGVLLFFLIIFLVRKQKDKFLLTWMAVPLLLPFFFSFFFPLFTPKYALVAGLPLFFMLGKVIKRRRVMFALLFLLITTLVWQAITSEKDPWDEVSEYVNGTVFVMKSYEIIPFVYYEAPECFSSPDIYVCARSRGVFTHSNDVRESEFLLLSREEYLSVGEKELLKSIEKEELRVFGSKWAAWSDWAYEQGWGQGSLNEIVLYEIISAPTIS